MNLPTRSKVISIRMSTAEYSQLVTDAEAQKQAVSGVLITAWRNQNVAESLTDRLDKIANRLEEIESTMPDLNAIAEWAGAVNASMTQTHEANMKHFSNVEQLLVAIAESAGLRVRQNA